MSCSVPRISVLWSAYNQCPPTAATRDSQLRSCHHQPIWKTVSINHLDLFSVWATRTRTLPHFLGLLAPIMNISIGAKSPKFGVTWSDQNVTHPALIWQACVRHYLISNSGVLSHGYLAVIAVLIIFPCVSAQGRQIHLILTLKYGHCVSYSSAGHTLSPRIPFFCRLLFLGPRHVCNEHSSLLVAVSTESVVSIRPRGLYDWPILSELDFSPFNSQVFGNWDTSTSAPNSSVSSLFSVSTSLSSLGSFSSSTDFEDNSSIYSGSSFTSLPTISSSVSSGFTGSSIILDHSGFYLPACSESVLDLVRYEYGGDMD